MIDFIGLGAQKSGTSWVYANLYDHPEICIPVKEIHFFSRSRFEKGKDWYESHFEGCTTSLKKGEFSTSYLYSSYAAERIRDMYPSAKLLVILRNPVDRAYSQYGNAIKAGEVAKTVTFDSYIKNEPSCLEQGLYAQQLKRYFDVFPREQICVLIYEDIKKDPEQFMRNIYTFLKVDTLFVSRMLNRRINIARSPKNIGVEKTMHHIAEWMRKNGLSNIVHRIRLLGIPDLIRHANTQTAENIDDTKIRVIKQQLLTYFAKDVQETSALLGRDLVEEWKFLK